MDPSHPQVKEVKKTDDYVRLALNAGHFCVLLDGFDELELDRRDDVAFQIQDLSERHPGNWIILSSREDSTLDGWSNFAKFDLDPLSLERSVQLIQKLPFDDPVKGKFISDLRGGLYDSHRSFLSNPLLLSIMLLTYSDNAQIPLKLSLFYDQAYESLFQRHDALKGGFQRERRTSLDIQDFSKVFAAFCLQSYDKREFSFSRTKALQYLDRARVISQLSYKSEEFLADAVQGVCLLIEDGLDITFAHRSFQEYFVARFIQASKLPAKQRLVERYLPSFYHELVMELLYEMDPEAVEEYFLIPSIEKLKDVIGVREKIGATHVTRFLKALYSDFMIDFYHEDKQERLGATIENSQLYSMIKFMRPRLRPKVGVGKHRKVVWRDLIDSLRKTYNRDYVPARALRTGDLFVRELIEQGAFDIGLLPELFRFGEAAKIRQAEAAASLESVLA